MSAAHTEDAAAAPMPDAWTRGYLAQRAVQEHLESSAGVTDFFGRLTTTVAGLVGARRVAFALLDPSGRWLAPQADAHGFSAGELAAVGPVACAPEGRDLASRIVYANASFHAATDLTNPEMAPFAEAVEALGVTDAIAVCWRAGSTPVGTLTALDSQRGGFTADDVRVLRSAAQAAGAVWRHQQAEAELVRLYQEARDASDAVDGFVSTIVHELRGPLTVICGYAGMIARGELGEPPEAWTRPLGFLVEHAGRMNRLVDDLLLAARLSAGRHSAALRRMDVREAVTAALSRATARAELAGAGLDATLPDDPVTVVADSDHVALILDNLLGNAITYGATSVTVRAGAEDGQATVSVTDDGRGIPVEMRDRIFERFARATGPGGPPGTGLGLYISRELANQLGGSLRLVESEPGVGSTFALRLPLAGDLEAAPPSP
ncbi:MAG TPA: ATP-binding protein [Candidatus Dormibacteraeota bacterium]